MENLTPEQEWIGKYNFETGRLNEKLSQEAYNWALNNYDRTEELRRQYFKEHPRKEINKIPDRSVIDYDENSVKKRLVRGEFLELISGKIRKTSEATELLVRYILDHYYIYTTKDDVRNEIWIYKDGIYLPQGRTEIKIILRDVLGEWFNSYYYNQVIDKIEPDTAIDTKKFFRTNYTDEVPVENGILNIITRELTPFTPEKIFFNKLPVVYDPSKTCPAIDLFLNEILSSEEDKKVFYEIAGFSLLKEYRYEKAFMFVGDGRNGKGKCIQLLKRLVGSENCCSIPLCSLVPESFQLSELFGKMLNLAGDIGNRDLQDTSMFKSATGRDLITTKRKFLSGLSFENYAKFVFACNELPTVYDTSKGFWDRWVLLQFPYTFLDKEEIESSKDKSVLKVRDDEIIKKIITPQEMSGLLNMALDGLKRLIENKKFSITIGTKDIKDIWIRKANSFMAFAIDNIEEDYESHISKKDMRKKYANYCKQHNLKSRSDFKIKQALQESYGVIEERILVLDAFGRSTGDYEWVWQGVKWR